MTLPPHFLDSTPEKLVFNRTVTLRDTWAKIEKGMKDLSVKGLERPEPWRWRYEPGYLA